MITKSLKCTPLIKPEYWPCVMRAQPAAYASPGLSSAINVNFYNHLLVNLLKAMTKINL